MRPLGRAVRPPPRYGEFYAKHLGRGRHSIHLHAHGNRSTPDIYVSTHPSREAADMELRCLREGYEL